MIPKKYRHMVFNIATAGLLLVGPFWLLNGTPRIVHADPGDLFVTPSGSGDCTQASPCDLQTALGLAVEGETLYLAQGIYTGTGRAVITVTKSITLYGGWDRTASGPVVRDPEAYLTTLSGEDSRQVVYISGDISPTIDGFIISGGKAEDGGGVYISDASPMIQNNVITANGTTSGGAYADGRGGGIYIDGSSNAVIAQNRILSNTSGYGGGIYHFSSAAITLTANEIIGNTAIHRGGGIMIERAPDIVQTNVISDNIANDDGGGMVIWAASPQVEANRMENNSASSVGGGISMGNNATPNLMNNMLINNARDGLFVGSSSPVVINNTIVGSELSGSGDGIDLRSNSGCSPPYCTTGTYTNNIVVSYEIGIYGTGPITPAIDYNDVWGNVTSDYNLPSGVVTGRHNISLDPVFSNPAADDYHLQSDSPCVDAGDPAGVPPAPPTDIDGDSRRNDARVDIGADELRQDR